MKKLNFLIVLCLLMAFQSYAQRRNGSSQGLRKYRSYNSFRPYWTAGVGIGIGNYFGDLAPKDNWASTKLADTRPGFTGTLIRQLTPRWGVGIMASYQRLMGSDFKSADPNDNHHRYRYIRNAHFRNDVFELSLRGTFDIKPTYGLYYKRPTYRPYILLGVGAIYHNPKAKTPEGDWVALQPLRTEGQGQPVGADAEAKGIEYKKPYSLIQPVVPLGVGLRYKLNDKMDLALEVGYRVLFTDFIDDVGGNYADPSDLPSDLSRIMANRTMEAKDALTGKERDFTPIENIGGSIPYGFSSQYNGGLTARGFGNLGDKRGDPKDKDIYIVTGFHLNIILNTGVKCPKFRR